jgi:hypothetical protein
MAHPLAMTTSDHVLCVISIETTMPKSNIFRFENNWLEMEGFLPLVELTWTHSIHYADVVKRIIAKFKLLRRELKKWSRTLSSIKEDIVDLNSLISLLDAIENFRDFSPMEGNFRMAMKKHVVFLLKKQLTYWNQRGKIKWVTLGDENSRFFQSMASSRKRKHHIATLNDSSGAAISDHSAKANLLLLAYKERLGQRVPPSSFSPMAHLVQNNIDFSFLEARFSPEEIDAVVKEFPNNKSPGLDVFNAEFLKKCWPVIKNDFYDLCNKFHAGNLYLQIINSCFITLVPKKKENSETVHDFRPISLYFEIVDKVACQQTSVYHTEYHP